jgi:hypothetical protein
MYSQLRTGPFKPNYPFVLNAGSDQARGLVGWWPGIAGDGKLRDLSGNGNHGTFNGTTPSGGWWTAGNGGGRGAVGKFDGSTTYISFKLVQPTLWSLCFWINMSVTTSYQTVLAQTSSGPGLYIKAGQLDWFQVADHVGIQTLSVKKWYHIAVTFAGGTALTYYINGILDKSISLAATFPNATTPGWGYDSSFGDGNLGKGYFEDPRIYNRALSAPEVLSQYEHPWQLRYQPGRVRYFLGGGAAAGVSPWWTWTQPMMGALAGVNPTNV